MQYSAGYDITALTVRSTVQYNAVQCRAGYDVTALIVRNTECIFRVTSSKSGKIYLHTDVRMIIFRKSDLDTATEHESGKGWELR